MTWTHVQTYEKWIDFDCEVMSIDDTGNTSLDVRLSFDTETRTAYMTVAWHNDDGNTQDLGQERDIEWAAAVEMVRHNCDKFPEELR